MSFSKINQQLAAELNVRPPQVEAAIALLDGGATVPFIARYRKESTDGLDDVQLRELEMRLTCLRQLEDRRIAVVRSVTEQSKLTPDLQAAFVAAPTKKLAKRALADASGAFRPAARDERERRQERTTEAPDAMAAAFAKLRG